MLSFIHNLYPRLVKWSHLLGYHTIKECIERMSIVAVGIMGKLNEPIYTTTEMMKGVENDSNPPPQPPSSSSFADIESERLHLESILFTSLDVIEVHIHSSRIYFNFFPPNSMMIWSYVYTCMTQEKRGKKSKEASYGGDNFLGQLLLIEDYKVFGSISNTLTKFVLILDGSSNASNDTLKEILTSIQKLYTNEIMNPFYEIGRYLFFWLCAHTCIRVSYCPSLFSQALQWIRRSFMLRFKTRSQSLTSVYCPPIIPNEKIEFSDFRHVSLDHATRLELRCSQWCCCRVIHHSVSVATTVWQTVWSFNFEFHLPTMTTLCIATYQSWIAFEIVNFKVAGSAPPPRNRSWALASVGVQEVST